MESTGGDWESGLLAALELSCARVRRLIADSSGLPEHEVQKLRREQGYLAEYTDSEIDWEALAGKLQAEGLSDLLSAAVDQLARGSLTEIMTRDSTGEAHPDLFWRYVLVPILKRFGDQRPDWQWDVALARKLTAEWSAEQMSRAEGSYRTISPLWYFEGPDEPLLIEDGLIIRPFTDREREELWRDYGRMGGDSLGELVLDSWSHVIDYRWKQPPGTPLGHDTGIAEIEDVVRALRIRHSGIVQRTIVWTRWDPPTDEYTSPYHRVFLSAPVLDYEHRAMRDIHDEMFHGEHVSRTEIELRDGEQIGEILQRMRTAQGDRRLALAFRRFDSAYSRDEYEDSLIDLWIAFEALLLPDGQSELSYRAALRIAALIGNERAERSEAFKQARLSYKCRSQVVHGELTAENLDDVVTETRELARKVLRSWILSPPQGGVEEIDQRLF